MLDKQEIRKEIARLEYEESSYPNYAKLADLYIIRAEMEKPDAKIEPRYERLYSGAAAPAGMHMPQNGQHRCCGQRFLKSCERERCGRGVENHG